MRTHNFHTLPTMLDLALAHAPSPGRAIASAAFALDLRLGQFVAQASEPLVAQLRLAWWREQLGKRCEERAKGDAILDAVTLHWGEHSRDLAALVDGWEQLLAEHPIADTALIEFADGRSRIFTGLAVLAGLGRSVDEAARAGRIWAFADLAAHSSDDAERRVILDLAESLAGTPIHLPRTLRHLTILGELGRSALLRGGVPLLARRRDALKVMRLGMFGR
ncbi:MAG: hypothetical protein R3D99_09680 [Altererythrobacter sp.]